MPDSDNPRRDSLLPIVDSLRAIVFTTLLLFIILEANNFSALSCWNLGGYYDITGCITCDYIPVVAFRGVSKEGRETLFFGSSASCASSLVSIDELLSYQGYPPLPVTFPKLAQSLTRSYDPTEDPKLYGQICSTIHYSPFCNGSTVAICGTCANVTGGLRMNYTSSPEQVFCTFSNGIATRAQVVAGMILLLVILRTFEILASKERNEVGSTDFVSKYLAKFGFNNSIVFDILQAIVGFGTAGLAVAVFSQILAEYDNQFPPGTCFPKQQTFIFMLVLSIIGFLVVAVELSIQSLIRSRKQE